MKIEAVTVSVDYSRWLRQVVSNKDKFDRWIIATHESDRDTIRVCEDNGIEYVCSERVFTDASFAKGRAINDALKLCDKDDWLVHIDADIKLADNFNEEVNFFCDNKNALYGMYRETHEGNLLVQKLQKTITNKITGKKIIQHIGEMGAIGYFQMWHSNKRKWYDEQSLTGAEDDASFMNSFKPTLPKKSYRENWKTLPTNCIDVSGFQGHFKKHFFGIRNLEKIL